MNGERSLVLGVVGEGEVKDPKDVGRAGAGEGRVVLLALGVAHLVPLPWPHLPIRAGGMLLRLWLMDPRRLMVGRMGIVQGVRTVRGEEMEVRPLECLLIIFNSQIQTLRQLARCCCCCTFCCWIFYCGFS